MKNYRETCFALPGQKGIKTKVLILQNKDGFESKGTAILQIRSVMVLSKFRLFYGGVGQAYSMSHNVAYATSGRHPWRSNSADKLCTKVQKISHD